MSDAPQKRPLVALRGVVAKDGRAVTVYSTRLCTLAQPMWWLDSPPGEYVCEDRYHTEIIVVKHADPS